MNPNVGHHKSWESTNSQDRESELILKPGMCFTVEPILTEGSPKIAGPWIDQWTYVIEDGGWSAQYEHILLITKDGCEVLTKV